MSGVLYRSKARWGDNPVGELRLPYVTKIVNSFGVVERQRFTMSNFWDCSCFVYDDWVDGEFPIVEGTRVLGFVVVARCNLAYKAAVSYTKQSLELYKNVNLITTDRFVYSDWQYDSDVAYEKRPQDKIVKKHDVFTSMLSNYIEFAGECASVVLMDNIGLGGSVRQAFTIIDFLVYLCRLHSCNVFAYNTINIVSTEGAMYSIELVHNRISDMYFTKYAVLGGVRC